MNEYGRRDWGVGWSWRARTGEVGEEGRSVGGDVAVMAIWSREAMTSSRRGPKRMGDGSWAMRHGAWRGRRGRLEERGVLGLIAWRRRGRRRRLVQNFERWGSEAGTAARMRKKPEESMHGSGAGVEGHAGSMRDAGCGMRHGGRAGRGRRGTGRLAEDSRGGGKWWRGEGREAR
jgi:hypothetical protein